MRTCPECKVLVGGPGGRCPLCGAPLSASDGSGNEAPMYPVFVTGEKRRSSFPFLAKIFAFISLLAVCSCTLINLLVNGRMTWSLFVVGAIATAWLTVGLHLLARFNLNYQLLIDLVAVSLFLVLIDRLTGWTRWSVDYVIPILYIGVMITTVVLALVFRVFWREYILSLVAVCVLGLAPLVIFLTGSSPIRFLCLGAALMAAALLIGILFFAGGKFFSEWKRRMNI